MNPNSIGEVLKRGRAFLKSAGIDSWMLDAELLLTECAGIDRLRLLTEPGLTVDDKELEVYETYLRQRAGKKPVQYILNRCEFMSLEFYLNEDVLIPRPDTETLVEASMDIIKERGYKSILEIGTGSGCISVSLAHYLNGVAITACDKSGAALEVARENALKNGVSRAINFVLEDCFRALCPDGESYDMIISNPPYIPTDEIEILEDNVKLFEPRTALDGGADGLDFYRAVATDAKKILRPGGGLAFEIGCGQAKQVGSILEENGFKKINVIKDLSGLDRVIIIDAG